MAYRRAVRCNVIKSAIVLLCITIPCHPQSHEKFGVTRPPPAPTHPPPPPPPPCPCAHTHAAVHVCTSCITLQHAIKGLFQPFEGKKRSRVYKMSHRPMVCFLMIHSPRTFVFTLTSSKEAIAIIIRRMSCSNEAKNMMYFVSRCVVEQLDGQDSLIPLPVCQFRSFHAQQEPLAFKASLRRMCVVFFSAVLSSVLIQPSFYQSLTD